MSAEIELMPGSTSVLVRNWHLLALRGVAALLFGLITLFDPGIGLAALVLLFGAYAIADGILTIALVVAHRRGERHWVWAIMGGLLSIVVGVLTFVMPGVTALALLFLIAAYLVIVGVTEIATSIRLRKVIDREWLLILSGVLAVALGVLLAIFPAPGALAVVLWIGAWAVATGILLLMLAVKLRSSTRRHQPVATPGPA
jgi:uncharacterized membrane protein HdeD (DUF308 family)